MSQTINDFQDLTPPQKRALEHISQDPYLTEVFFFTGGTLLKALGLVPRASNDLDLFTFADVDSHLFIQRLAHLGRILEIIFGAGTIAKTDQGYLHTDSGMIIDAVADSTPNIDDFVSFNSLKTAGLKDLAAHKASALCSRDELKDYIDIAFLTRHQQWTLADLEKLAEQKFHLGTITEEKLLAELLAKRQAFIIPDDIFLRSPAKCKSLIAGQIEHLLQDSSL